MRKLTPRDVRRLAENAADSVTSSGSVGGDTHNIRLIEYAIVQALAMERGCTYESALEHALMSPRSKRKRKKK